MGAEPWGYFVPYDESPERALEMLRKKVFETGQFQGSELNPTTPMEALENMEDQGTCSILDILSISESPEICAVCPLSEEELREYFGTVQPTHEMVDRNHDFYEPIERGQGVYIVVYKDGKPSEYFFGGYSFD